MPTMRLKKRFVALGALTLVAALLAAGYARDGGLRRSTQSAPVGMASEARDAIAGVEIAPAPDSAKLSAGQSASSMGSASAPSAPNAAGAAGAVGAAGAPQQALPPFSVSVADRMIVKTGALTLQLGEGGDVLSAAMQRVNAVVAGIPGAYVAASSTSYRAETPPGIPLIAREPGPPMPRPIVPPQPSTTATLTLKVPVDAFDQTMQRLREIGSPLAEHVGTQEVTEEYVDLEAQVRNLEATEQQYLRFLERAQRFEEILPIQQRLTEVRGQIERLRGRMTLLQRRADVSTITVSLVAPAGKGTSNPGDPRALRTLKEAWAHLAVALSGALDLLIYVTVYALPLIPLAVAIVWWRRRQSRPATAGGAI